MQNVTITKQLTAQINLTPAQWELYASSRDCSEAAEALNRAAEAAIASSISSWEAMQKMAPVMRKYASFGALDTEPLYVAKQVMSEAFGNW